MLNFCAESRTVVECAAHHPEHVLADIDNGPQELELNLELPAERNMVSIDDACTTESEYDLAEMHSSV